MVSGLYIRGLGLRLILILALVLIAAQRSTLMAEPSERLAGQLLVAQPDLDDPNFHQSVIYLVEHDEEGAFGLVVNQFMARVPLKALADHFDMDETADTPLTFHYGGPVSPRALFVLHSDDVVLDGSLQLPHALALSGNADILRHIANGEGPDQFRIVFGYAGWGPGQVEAEIAEGTWEVIDYDPDLVFGDDLESWEEAIDRRPLNL